MLDGFSGEATPDLFKLSECYANWWQFTKRSDFMLGGGGEKIDVLSMIINLLVHDLRESFTSRLTSFGSLLAKSSYKTVSSIYDAVGRVCLIFAIRVLIVDRLANVVQFKYFGLFFFLSDNQKKEIYFLFFCVLTPLQQLFHDGVI